MTTLLFVALAVAAATVGWRDREELANSTRGYVAGFVVLCIGAAIWTAYDPYLLAKTIARLAMPAGILFAVLFAVPFVALYHFKHRVAALAVALCLTYALAGNEWVGGVLLGSLEREFYPRVHPVDADVLYDAVMVLGGGSAGSDTHYFVSHAGDRILTGARLYLAGKTPILITSGSTVPGSTSFHNSAEATAEIWTDLDIPEEAIRQVSGPHNTREEIDALAEIVEAEGFDRVGLVTSAWHLRRAMQLVDAEGLSDVVEPIPADFRSSSKWDGIYSVIPSGSGFHRVHKACWEYLGAAVGR